MTRKRPKRSDVLPATLPWEKQERQSHRYAAIVIVGLLCLTLGFTEGFQLSHDPIIPTTITTTTSHGQQNNTTTPTNPTPPTPINTTDPTRPPPPAPSTTLLYGVVNVNPLEPGVNLSAPGWTIQFNGTNGLFSVSLTLQWNEWHTNTWFSYSIVLVSDVSYTVTVHQSMNTWMTVEGSITPTGANMSQNFITTGPAY